MSLYEKVIAKYPELTVEDFHPIRGVITLQDDADGFGPYIAKWDHPTLARPTDAELDIKRNPATDIIEGEIIQPVELIASDVKMDMSQFSVETPSE